ncbi:MAG: DMT family transporter [Prevotella sp.]|jgi:drug/metabolite transporter (DMT)-like permease|nr:DMT family transporter [Prevotella sp.]
MKHKGIICGILAAICYGTNPLGALPLYEEGVNTSSVLFLRFSIATLILGVVMIANRKSFAVTRGELTTMASLGALMAVSSLTYYQSFRYMDAGIASTILFVYPVMVAVIMATFFREKVTATTITSIVLALAGIGLLYRGDAGISLSMTGVMLVMVSSLTYAVYIVIVNQSEIRMSIVKLTFYVLLICAMCLFAYSFTSSDLHLMLPPSPRAWFFACWLGLVPTVLSLLFMTIAVHEVGATPTAIMGALEPLTAVAIGVMMFGEAFTFRLCVGIVLILAAVLLIVAGKHFLLRTITHTITSLVRKTWRWKS